MINLIVTAATTIGVPQEACIYYEELQTQILEEYAEAMTLELLNITTLIDHISVGELLLIEESITEVVGQSSLCKGHTI